MAFTTTWGVGDYPRMAEQLLPAAVETVEIAKVDRDAQVLDVATGTGNAALVAAARGAQTTGVDFEPSLLAIAGATAERDRLTINWLVGDAERLPIPNASADVVLSVFGVMYASDHEAAAAELARVVRPGGRVALAAWLPHGFLPALGQVFGSYLPPPPSRSMSPGRWGDIQQLRSLVGAHGLQLSEHRVKHLNLSLPDARSAADFLIDTAGHVVAERQRLIQSGRWDGLHEAVARFVDGHASPSNHGLTIRLDYLVALAVRNAKNYE
jgi:SAM-dependent methyltransferase